MLDRAGQREPHLADVLFEAEAAAERLPQRLRRCPAMTTGEDADSGAAR